MSSITGEVAKKSNTHCIGQKTGPTLPPNPDDGCYCKTCILQRNVLLHNKITTLQHTEGDCYEAAGANGNDDGPVYPYVLQLDLWYCMKDTRMKQLKY